MLVTVPNIQQSYIYGHKLVIHLRTLSINKFIFEGHTTDLVSSKFMKFQKKKKKKL